MAASSTPVHSGPPIEACATDVAPPCAADVVVIGGGIAGVSTAMFLAEQGVSVALCEKGALAAEQSSRNWGWVRKMGRDPRELPLMIETMRIWDGLQDQLGLDLGFRRSGIVYLCRTERELARRMAWLDHARDFQLDSRLIDGADIARVLPGADRRWLGALHTPSDGRAEPQRVVPALARRARELGTTIVAGCAVRGIETKAGRVAAAVTEHGTISCSSVVLAGGAWSRLFCRSLGLTLPQLKVLASVMRVDGVDNGPESAALCSDFAFRKRADGGYTVTGGTGSIADIVPDSLRSSACSCRWRRPSGGIPDFASDVASSRSFGNPRAGSSTTSRRSSARASSILKHRNATWTRAASSQGGVSRLQQCDRAAALGWAHRCNARCDPRHFRRGRTAWLLRRHGFFRPRIRHRTRRRTAYGRPRYRPAPDRGTGGLPLLPIRGWARLSLLTGL
jgi:glycine/D-amino acid oxidase-like deaminating enzyme